MANSLILVWPLSPELLPDFLAYFDGEAFADNPHWRSCYCQHLHVDHSQVKWSSRTAAENRAAASEHICAARMQGCEGFKAQGLTIAEAAPRPEAASDAQLYHGPLSMYLAAGFTIHRDAGDGAVIVRRSLA